MSRLANLYQARFVGFAFLALGYLPPTPDSTFEDVEKSSTQVLGRDPFGYMLWFSEEGTAEVIEKNVRAHIGIPHSATITLPCHRKGFCAQGVLDADMTWKTVRFIPKPDFPRQA